jgi:hypothetical protein
MSTDIDKIMGNSGESKGGSSMVFDYLALGIAIVVAMAVGTAILKEVTKKGDALIEQDAQDKLKAAKYVQDQLKK